MLTFNLKYDTILPVMRDTNKTFTVFWKTDNTINFKAFPMVKGEPDHRAFNDAIVCAGIISDTETDVRIECRKRNDRDGWDIEQVWPN